MQKCRLLRTAGLSGDALVDFPNVAICNPDSMTF